MSEQIEDNASEEAWNDFCNDHLTDGFDGYRSSDVWKACRAAFDKELPFGISAAIDAAKELLEA